MEASHKRSAIVTGGGNGIGRAIARAFVASGMQVSIIGRNSDKLSATARELGSSVIWQRADVGSREEVRRAVSNTVDVFGTIDVLVNNAGIARWVTTKTGLEEAETAIDEVLRTNVKGAYFMALATAPHLRRPGGRIINISSITAFSGGHGPGSMAYATSKAALNGLTFALARELSPEGITVNSVAPGLIADTEFNRDYPEEYQRAIVKETPVGRKGNTNDVAAAVQYLASREASFVTGEIVAINGGRIFGR
jgi:3-oxoacyl-[acyl-carrier protein] reductase